MLNTAIIILTVAFLWVVCGNLADAIEYDWHEENGYGKPPPENAIENLILGPLALIAALLTYNA